MHGKAIPCNEFQCNPNQCNRCKSIESSPTNCDPIQPDDDHHHHNDDVDDDDGYDNGHYDA
eukprot:1702647-Karenia_brevis.AAC.1